ncbi:hypothetical protein DINM_002058 [Dirofilaria immitis]|nr:hypothetical protein [Dirofilaria immitis]
MNIDELPDLVLEIVFSYLNQYSDLENVRLVNHRWELHVTEKEGNGAIAKRCSHSGCYHDGTKKVYIFGGCTDNYTAFNDLWSFDLRSRNWCREFIKCAPFPRPKAMAIFVPYKEYLILHGGFSKSSPNPIHQAANFFNEIHMYDTIKNEWIEIETEPSPPIIASHCGCVVDDSLIIFGGSQNSRATNTVYVLDIISKIWHKPSFTDPQPNPRYGSSCVVLDKSHLLVVGGCGGPNCIYNDAWLLLILILRSYEVLLFKITNPKAGPSQLWCHPACPIGRNLACISYARKNSGHGTISLNSYPHPLSLPQRTRFTCNLKYNNGTFGTTSGNSEKNWHYKRRLGNACVYILDTTRIFKDCTLTWRQQEIDSNAPVDTMLYSLCAGRAELIMFGGMHSNMQDDNHNPFTHAISNDIYVLSPTR